MNLIDRYIYIATEHLSEDMKNDVGRELRANIEDMLPENPTEEDVRAILEKLGNPKKLSVEYSQKKRYLIGPDLYDNYFSVLKLVVTIVVAVVTSITLLGWFLKPSAEVNTVKILVSIFTDVLASIIEGATQAALWVTFIFACLERSGINDGRLPFLKKKWSPDDLMEVQVPNKSNISRGETIFAMSFTVLFTALLYFQPQLIGWYTNGKNGLTLVEPLLVVERLQVYIPIILILALVSLSILIWKFLARHWNISLAVANTIYNAAMCTLLVLMLSDKSLLNEKFLQSLADALRISQLNIPAETSKATWVFAAIFITICVWESVSGFIKSKK